jgi:vesicle coat complex subunit
MYLYDFSEHVLFISQNIRVYANCLSILSGHLQDYIRSKAVIVLQHFYRVSPQLCLQYVTSVKVMVGDKDPGVVAHVLQFLLVVAEVHLILFML